MATPIPIQATTQQHLDIEDISENLVILKDGSVAMIITTTAVNFGLLSESEQDAIIYAYAALLNSLTFPIQILIRSNKMDISGYEKLLSDQEAKSPKPENKQRIRKYREFIEETVRQRNVLDKKFYIIIPFYILELGVTKSASALAKGGRYGLPFPKDYIINRSKMTLDPKRDHLLHQLARIGLRARQLTTKELIQLVFEIYNPGSAAGQTLATPQEYETPLVQPAMAFKEAPQIETPDTRKSQETAQPEPKLKAQPPNSQLFDSVPKTTTPQSSQAKSREFSSQQTDPETDTADQQIPGAPPIIYSQAVKPAASLNQSPPYPSRSPVNTDQTTIRPQINQTLNEPQSNQEPIPTSTSQENPVQQNIDQPESSTDDNQAQEQINEVLNKL